MNKVVHFEVPFDDKARAMKFYSSAFGWKLTDIAEMSYVMAETTRVNEQQMPVEPGAINGGLFQRPKEAPNPTIYVGVESIAEHTDPRHGRLRTRERHRRERHRFVSDRLTAQRGVAVT